MRYEYHVQIYFDQKNYKNNFHIVFIKIYVFNYSFNVFKHLAKEVFALYESTISKLNITIKSASDAGESLPLFANYIESWRIACWKTTFFKLFKSNDDIMKNKKN